jgi:hypothetical protein
MAKSVNATYWVWMLSNGERVLPLAHFDTKEEATEWVRNQRPIPNMTREVYYE